MGDCAAPGKEVRCFVRLTPFADRETTALSVLKEGLGGAAVTENLHKPVASQFRLRSSSSSCVCLSCPQGKLGHAGECRSAPGEARPGTGDRPRVGRSLKVQNMEGTIQLACKVMTVLHACWVDQQGKQRRTVDGMGWVRWEADGRACRIYLPTRLIESDLDGVIEDLSEYVGAPLERTSAETLPFVSTRTPTLRKVPDGCCPVQLSKWNTGIGKFRPGHLMDESEVEDAWWAIIAAIGPSAARWQTYGRQLYGSG